MLLRTSRGGLVVMDTATGKITEHLVDSGLKAVQVALSPDEKTLVSIDGRQLIAWDVTTGKPRWKQTPNDEMRMRGMSGSRRPGPPQAGTATQPRHQWQGRFPPSAPVFS